MRDLYIFLCGALGGPGVKKDLMDILPLIQGSENEHLHLAHRIDKYDRRESLRKKTASICQSLSLFLQKYLWGGVADSACRSRYQDCISVQRTKDHQKILVSLL